MPAAAKAAHHAPVRLLLAAGAAACALAGGAGEGLAQQRVRPGETVSQPVVQPLPNQDNLRLNAALSRLGRNPRDLDALIDAGSAALALGDVDAATGFFKRADQVSTNDARVKAGLGGARAEEAILSADEDIGGVAPTAQVLHPCVMKGPDSEGLPDAGYWMFYNAHSELFAAWSADGEAWEKLGAIGLDGADFAAIPITPDSWRIWYGRFAEDTLGEIILQQ